jgi:hypothetical protein
MITRRRVYLELRADPVPEASHQLEREGWAVLRGAFSKDEVERLRADVERVRRTCAESATRRRTRTSATRC